MGKYRCVNDDEGLISISYSISLPYNFKSLFDDELVTCGVAAEYLRVKKAKIRDYIKEGLITTIFRKGVLLKDVNKIKNESNPCPHTMLCPASQTM